LRLDIRSLQHGRMEGLIRTIRRFIPAILFGTLLLAQATRAATSATRPPLVVLRQAITSQRVVALTFDDGPSVYTPQILAVLRNFHARATFFAIGEHVLQYPNLVREVVGAGDEVGNHTYTHVDLRYVSNETMQAELIQTQKAIRTAAGITPVWFRPPYGGIDSRVTAVVASLGLRSIFWSVDPRDWSRPGTTAIIQRVLTATVPGSVIIMHDGGGDRSETVAALPFILTTLRQEGYRLLTLSALFHLPPQTSCDTRSAARWFAAAGYTALKTNAIYRAWLGSYCRGDNFGPATSREYVLKRNVMAQDFAHTDRRLEWARSSGSIHVTLMWSWATAVFTKRGIQPRWHTAITRAWFDQYFQGHNWGRALDQPRSKNGAEIQCFLRGCAVGRGGSVTWRKRK
jgi:peptidoglycan-N-acetylglucosamine deacetylase